MSETPGDVAIQPNYWTLSIQDLDGIIDRLKVRASALGAQYPRYAGYLRDAEKLVRELRDELLAENYDANRHGKSVRG